MSENKIYSRKRINLSKSGNEKKIRIIKVILIFAIAFIVFFSTNSNINPVFDILAKNKAKEISTDIINLESSKVINDVQYENLVNIEKDTNGRITLIQLDVIEINLLASDIAYNIQGELKKLENTNIKIPFGSLFGVKYLSGFGPKINIQIYPIGNVLTSLKSKFEQAGINQTIHRLYLDIECSVNVVSSYGKIEEKISSQVLMAETVIVGEIPSSYYNLDGIDKSETIRIMK